MLHYNILQLYEGQIKSAVTLTALISITSSLMNLKLGVQPKGNRLHEKF